MKFNNDYRHDLAVGQVYERQLAEILESQTVEVKRDFGSQRTGNIFVEYFSRGKPSGLATTQADYYCYVISENLYILMPTERLKQLCRPYYGTKRDVRGGDSNTSKGILLPVNKLLEA